MALFTIRDDGVAMLGDVPPIKLSDKGQITPSTAELLSNTLRAIVKKLNGLVFLGTGLNGHRAGNIDAQYIDVLAPSAPNTEFPVVHGLSRVPIGYDVVRKDRAVDVYDSSAGSWTDKLFFLKASVADASIKLRVY